MIVIMECGGLTPLFSKPFFDRFDRDAHTNIGLWRQDNWYNPFSSRDRWIYRPDGHSEPKDRLPLLPYNPNDPNYMEKMKVHAKLLAEMIPPLSSPAGGKPLKENTLPSTRKIDLDKDLRYKNNDFWPDNRPKKTPDQQQKKRWLHGDYKDAPYLLTHKLYEKIKDLTQGD